MKTIFITGGARGIGLATARLFYRKGWKVAIYDQDKEALEAVRKEIPSVHFETHYGDVLDYGSVQLSLLSLTRANGGRLDALFNNAGIVSVGEFDALPLDEHLRIIDVNLKGMLTTTYAALTFLKLSEGACIVNMSSASALYGNPEITAYAATKSAVSSLTEGWAIAWRKYGIRVTDLLPIFVRTRMVDDYHQDYRNLNPEKVRLTAEDVAEKVWEAVHGKRTHYYVGLETKVYARLVNWLPERWLPGIIRKVLGYYD